MAHVAGLVTAFGHVSARVPGTQTYLIPTRASPALAEPDAILRMDLDGNVLEGAGTPNTEFWIHARIYAARPDVEAVAHVHPPGCIALGQVGESVRPVHNSAAVFGQVPVYGEAGLIRSRELGDAVAAVLGGATAMLLRGHGANVAARSLREAAVLACFLEEGAEIQLRALAAAGGDPGRVRYFDETERERVKEQLYATGPIERAWAHYAALAGSGSERRAPSRTPKKSA